MGCLVNTPGTPWDCVGTPFKPLSLSLPMSSTNPKTYEPSTPHKVVFLGLGVMGYPMAAHLSLAGHQVSVYNRTATKSMAFCAEFKGATHGLTPKSAVTGADIVFCCVGNDDDLRSVVLGPDGAFAGMP